MKSLLRFAVVPLVAVLAACISAPAPAAAQPEMRFNRDIRPILSHRCFKCHGPDLKKGGLDLQNRAGALAELTSGQLAIVPGHAAESALIERVPSHDDKERMPPKNQGKPLTAAQVATLRAWID